MPLFKLKQPNNDSIKKLMATLETPELDSSFTERVMIRIKREGMKPRYIFTLEKWSFKLGVTLSLILSIWSVNAFWYSLKSSGALVFVELGVKNIEIWQGILSNLSYAWIIIALASFAFVIYLLRSHPLFLKWSFGIASLGMFLFINLSGLTLVLSGGNEYIQDKIVTEEISIPVLNNYYKNQAQFNIPTNQHLLGKVKEVQEDSIIVETPYQEKIILPFEEIEKAQVKPIITESFSKKEIEPQMEVISQPESEIIPEFKEGDFIIGLGNRKDGTFSPKNIQIKSFSEEYERFFPEYFEQKREEQEKKWQEEWEKWQEQMKKMEFPLEKDKDIPSGSLFFKNLKW
jgi:hypothetical protein